jgi:hypothetical protein
MIIIVMNIKDFTSVIEFRENSFSHRFIYSSGSNLDASQLPDEGKRAVPSRDRCVQWIRADTAWQTAQAGIPGAHMGRVAASHAAALAG